ncbi:MAG TPA: hypothetical protein PLS03_15100 [Terrimicrobiaceae bacterium]|nr:hypothetical protein [Terrimicrobiaceae bacterium]
MRSARQSGFSLCEVVISLGIFTFALTALLGLLPTALTAGRNAIDEAAAGHVAEQVAAEVRRTGEAGGDWMVDALGRRTDEREEAVYHAEVRLTDGSSDRLKRLTVTLSREGQTTDRRSFTSLIFLDGA